MLVGVMDLIGAQQKPRLVPVADQRSQNYGTSTKFLCSIQEGTPPLEFVWQKNGQSLSARKLSLGYRVETNQDDSMLIIANLSAEDSGNYSCIVRNDLGYDYQYTVLIVKGLLWFDFVSIRYFQSDSMCGAYNVDYLISISF